MLKAILMLLVKAALLISINEYCNIAAPQQRNHQPFDLRALDDLDLARDCLLLRLRRVLEGSIHNPCLFTGLVWLECRSFVRHQTSLINRADAFMPQMF